MTIDEQLEFLRKGAVEIIRAEDLRAKLEKSARAGKPLRVKLGADPTAPALTMLIALLPLPVTEMVCVPPRALLLIEAIDPPRFCTSIPALGPEVAHVKKFFGADGSDRVA